MKPFSSITTFCIILLLHLNSFAQVSIHEFFPIDVSAFHVGDTFLNRSVILKREGIRKVMSYRDSTGSIFTLSKVTQHLNIDGTVKERVTCIKAKKAGSSFFCS